MSGHYRRGGSNIPDDPDLLKGVLASEREPVVYPDDRCLQCEREFETTGKVTPPELCWHRHWRTADEVSSGHEVR